MDSNEVYKKHGVINFGWQDNPSEDISKIELLPLSRNKIMRLINWFDFVEVEGFEKPIDGEILNHLLKALER
jgi:hypothetical protein